MELQQVRYFLATCEYLNFTRAAQACNVTQPALTKALKLLELELGGNLFDRQIRPMQLTELGEHLVIKFRALQELKIEISAQAKLFNGSDQSTYRLGIVNTTGHKQFLHITNKLQHMAPDIDLSISLLSQTALRNRLLEGRLEMAILVDIEDDKKKFSSLDLYEEDYVLALSKTHKLNGKSDITLQDLDQLDYIYRTHCELNMKLDARFKKSGISLRKKLSTDQDSIALKMIQAGQGVSIMPKLLTQSNVNTRPIQDLKLSRVIKLAYLPGRNLSSAAKKIKDIVTTELKASVSV